MSKKRFVIPFFLLAVLMIVSFSGYSQCSICTRTAQQLGEEPAKGLNAGILYLAALPLSIIGIVYYKWKSGTKDS